MDKVRQGKVRYRKARKGKGRRGGCKIEGMEAIKRVEVEFGMVVVAVEVTQRNEAENKVDELKLKLGR